MNTLSPTDCPFYLITRASLAVTATMKRVLAQNGLSDIKPAYIGALMCLWTGDGIDEMLSKFGCEDGMKLTELGRCAGLEPSTMTGLVDRMERDGLVFRSSDPNDRRAQRATLTEKGAQIQARVIRAIDQMLNEAFGSISPEEMKTLKKILRSILANADKGAATHGK